MSKKLHKRNPNPGGLVTASLRLVDLFLRLSLAISSYWQDLVAIFLLVLALVSVLGIVGLTSGRLVDPWADLLRLWLGWGAGLVPLTSGFIGAMLLADNFGRTVAIRWGRVVAGELAALASLGLLSLFSGLSVEVAESGRGGGLIGWGIAVILGDMFGPALAWRTVALAAVLLVGAAVALDLSARRLGRLGEWLRWKAADWEEKDHGTSIRGRWKIQSPSGVRASAGQRRRTEPAKVSTPERMPEGRKPPIPREYRKNFKVDARRDNTPPRPRKRSKLLPPLELLAVSDTLTVSEREINRNAAIIEKTLDEFGLPARVVDFKTGPSVTQFAVEPGFIQRPGPDGQAKRQKVRVSQISALADDLALALSASSLRIEAPVPGHSYVGIEVPNERSSLVALRPVMESEAFHKIASPLAVALGRDVSGSPLAADLATMPHLLIAGTTGSGKSVCITAITTCLVTNNTPDDLRLVMIDPKMVELVRFNGLPHLFGKVETELDRILGVLRWCAREMDRRYKLFEEVSARNLEAYHKKTARRKDADRLPRIVILLDELADLMMMAPDQTERTLVRLAQMARATGMHLVVATQRPSTDIVTGLIKANFPARISFSTASSVDSRVILDTVGAESLLGRGDMLYLSPESGAPARLQGCYVSDKEVDNIVNYWREQVALDLAEEQEEATAPPVPELAPWDQMLARESVLEDKDDLIERAIQVIQKHGRASASLLQRKLNLGYPRAARLMDELHAMGLIGRAQAGGKTREVLVQKDDDPIGDRATRIIGDDREE